MTPFAERLKTLRRSSGMSQIDLAERLGVAKSTISMYEQGKREPNFEVLLQIMDIFHVTADDLLGIQESNTENFSRITLAAHLNASDLTQAEAEDVADYINYIKSKRK